MTPDPEPPDRAGARRQQPTHRQAKALAHPLRLRILRALGEQDLTNRELAGQLDADPATVLYHVRTLADSGFVEQLPARRGTRGAREKPYRSTGESWWLSDPLADAPPQLRYGPVALALSDAAAAGPDRLADFATLVLHLNAEEMDELDEKILAVLDAYVSSDAERRTPDRQPHRLLFLAHRLPHDTVDTDDGPRSE